MRAKQMLPLNQHPGRGMPDTSEGRRRRESETHLYTQRLRQFPAWLEIEEPGPPHLRESWTRKSWTCKAFVYITYIYIRRYV